ncbi:MAG: hypothetical protein QOF76_4154, partial [Solirubrobacteraceae bacterium]|nr:hypothetical protein [Solirubrobacteraceae bacterium]
MPHLRRALTGAFLLMALLAPSAQATKVNINGGATTLAFNAKTARAFAASGLSIKTVDGAKATKTGKALFPITGGRVDTVTGIGNVVHEGGLAISAGKTIATLSGLEINTATGKLSVS